MIRTLFADLLSFVKKPNDQQITLSITQKFKLIFILLSIELILTFSIILPLNLGINELVQVKNMKYDYSDTFLQSLLLWVLLVPFIEELVFRYVLRYQGLKKRFLKKTTWNIIFPALVYIFSIGFGFIHISNYLNEDKLFLILSPFIILSQLLGGLIITFIRVRINFVWGVLYHCLWNFLFVIAVPILEINISKPYIEKNENYKISIIEKPFYNLDESQTLKVDSANGKIYNIKLNQYSLQNLLDTLYIKDKYYVDDVLIKMEYNSKKGVTEKEFIDVLRKEYDIN